MFRLALLSLCVTLLGPAAAALRADEASTPGEANWIVARASIAPDPPAGLSLAGAPRIGLPPGLVADGAASAPAVACFRREIDLGASRPERLQLLVRADERFVLWLEGVELARSSDPSTPRWVERGLPAGTSRVALAALVRKEDGRPSPMALQLRLRIVYADGSLREVATDADWRVGLEQEGGWRLAGFAGAWSPARELEAPEQALGALAPARPPDSPNGWYAFRTTVELQAADLVAAVPARIAVDSRYWLWINGRLVVREGGLKRGPTPLDTYVDEIDLGPHLRPGENTLAVLLCYFGKDGFSHKSSGRPGLFLDAPVGARRLASDASWRAIRHPAFESTGRPHPNARLSESNLRFDARADIGAWQAAHYDDSGWPAAVECGAPPAAPWNRLVPRPIPQWRFGDLEPYVNDVELLERGAGVLEARLPRNLMVQPALRVRAPAGSVIEMRPVPYQSGGSRFLRAEYVTREGEQEFESPLSFNGNAVRYTIPAGVELLALGYRSTGYDTDFVGSFRCDDPFLERLWEKACTTLALNMRDSIQDPDRERAQWWGDAVIASGQMLVACDARSHALIEKAIRNLVDWQKGNGVLYAPVPSATWEWEVPLQMLAAVGPYGLGNYYLHTGDRQTIEHAWPAVERYLSLWQTAEDGLVLNRPGDWAWADWGEGADYALLENLWFALALDGAAQLAGVSSDPAAPELRRRADAQRARIDRVFWRGDGYRSELAPVLDDRANALAVLARVAGPERWPVLVELLSTRELASPYMEKYVLEALFAMDAPHAAIARMKRRYADMVGSDLTTLWENWTLRAPTDGINHAWSGGPLTLLVRDVAGVRPLEPAYSLFEVAPAMGPLTDVRVEVPTPRGTIRVALRGAGPERIEVEVPEGTRARVACPRRPGSGPSSGGHMQLNGEELAGVGEFARLQGGRWPGVHWRAPGTLELPPGTWSLGFSAD